MIYFRDDFVNIIFWGNVFFVKIQRDYDLSFVVNE